MLQVGRRGAEAGDLGSRPLRPQPAERSFADLTPACERLALHRPRSEAIVKAQRRWRIGGGVAPLGAGGDAARHQAAPLLRLSKNKDGDRELSRHERPRPEPVRKRPSRPPYEMVCPGRSPLSSRRCRRHMFHAPAHRSAAGKVLADPTPGGSAFRAAPPGRPAATTRTRTSGPDGAGAPGPGPTLANCHGCHAPQGGRDRPAARRRSGALSLRLAPPGPAGGGYPPDPAPLWQSGHGCHDPTRGA
jgi:hypothetical protein